MTDLSQTSAARRLRQFRADHPEYAKRNRKRAARRQRALEALARKYPEEFAALYETDQQQGTLLPEEEPEYRTCFCGPDGQEHWHTISPGRT